MIRCIRKKTLGKRIVLGRYNYEKNKENDTLKTDEKNKIKKELYFAA